MRRWQLSAFALGAPAKRAKPLSAAAASAALPNIVLPKGDFRRSVCSRIHPPWAPPWCWLGFVCVLAYGTLRHEKCRWGARKKVDRLCVANTTERNPVRKVISGELAGHARTSRRRDLFLKDSQSRE